MTFQRRLPSPPLKYSCGLDRFGHKTAHYALERNNDMRMLWLVRARFTLALLSALGALTFSSRFYPLASP